PDLIVDGRLQYLCGRGILYRLGGNERMMCHHSVRSIVILLFVMGASTRATEVLDQQNDVTGSGFSESNAGGYIENAQTFTVGVSGTLSRLGAQINWPGFGSPGNAILTVYNTSGGLPNASLGSATVPLSSIPSTGYSYISFDLSSFAIPVHVGEVLAYGISTNGDSTYVFSRDTQNASTYAGGESMYRQINPTGDWTFFSPSRDAGFQTYVIANSAGLPGDFNGDGQVDAADYVVWCKHLGDSDEAALSGNGDNMNGVDEGDYAVWRSGFGNTSASGAGLSASSVPEPTSVTLLIVGASWFYWAGGRRSGVKRRGQRTHALRCAKPPRRG
ncbi:MAG TPA: hypothetical protein VHE81_01030, partial [Lacipirellulaceae bacterium]|nr:hypothetical protein [Lacipirellulaceae bacterium]